MRKKEEIRGRVWLRRLFKIHTWLLVISFGLYFTFAFLDPGFFSYDLRQKFRALADETIAITATVLGPPVQPIVSAVAECDEDTDTLSVRLDWADDENTSTFDIDRDSLPLVSGLVASEYRDLNVSLGTTYEYIVVANGPMGPGSATSLPVTATTANSCGNLAADPTVNVISFNGENAENASETFETTDRTPLFTGVTNIPSAIVQIVLQSDPVYTATVFANVNGYWEWSVPASLSFGSHTLTVTATDPNDSSRTSTDIFTFNVVKRSGNTTSEKRKRDTAVPVTEEIQKLLETKPFLDFSLSLKNKDGVVAQGDELITAIEILSVDSKHNDTNVLVKYNVLDKEKKLVFFQTKETFIHAGRSIEERIAIPLYMQAEEYSLAVEFLFSDMTVSKVVSFRITELPLFKLSTGETITYADFVRNLGWLALLILIILLIWIFLFLREFALYLHGQGHITEQQLRNAGFIHK